MTTLLGQHLDNETIVVVVTKALYMAISVSNAYCFCTKVEAYLNCIFAVHEVAKFDPATFRQPMHLLISDGSLTRLFDRTELAKDAAGFIITDRAACDSGEIHGACRFVRLKHPS